MNLKRFPELFILFTVVLQLFTSCAGYTPDKESLLKRVNELWSARIQKDWSKVFELTDETYQNKESKATFATKGDFKGVLDFNVKEIEIAEDKEPYHHAEVIIRFSILRGGMKFQPEMKELWVFEPSNGWVLNKSAMIKKKPF